MHATATIEDYLGGIYDLAGSGKPVIGARLAKHMRVSAPTVTETLQRMVREGYVRIGPHKEVRFTKKGLALAETMARRHRLLERWITDVLELDWSTAHDEAHRLEHALSAKVEERLAKLLGMPSTCPHGNPIPGMPELPAHERVPLADASVNEEVIVDRISEEAEADRKLLDHLWQNGIRPGALLRVVELAPYVGTISAKLDDDRIVTLGLEAATKIWVRQVSKPQTKKKVATRSANR
jgi:DtxR family Mn-dependent transcriptional regulator